MGKEMYEYGQGLTIIRLNPNNYSKEEFHEIKSMVNGWNRSSDMIRERDNVLLTAKFFLASILIAVIITMMISVGMIVGEEFVKIYWIQILFIAIVLLFLVIFFTLIFIVNQNKDIKEFWKNHDYFLNRLIKKGLVKRIGQKPGDYYNGDKDTLKG